MASDPQTRHLLDLLAGDDRPLPERQQLVTLMQLLIELPPPPDPFGCFERYPTLKERFLASLDNNDIEEIEERFLELYTHLHMHEAPYTSEERQRVNATGGYWSHAGGLSPILKAGAHLRPDSISADFGAGNGLQCLLMQRLAPHRQTMQIEISSRMVEIGRELQRWLGIPPDRVEWIVDDVLNRSPAGFDFIYLYRPVRPDSEIGRSFYERFAADLEASEQQVVIFSIADCLRSFLSGRFQVSYCDGHLTCFRSSDLVPVSGIVKTEPPQDRHRDR